MLEVVGQLVPYGVAVALSPLPVIAVVLALLSPNGRCGGAAFLVGRVVAVAAIVGVAAAVADWLPEANGRSTAIAVLRLVLGGALVVWGTRSWVRRSAKGKPPEVPRWMASIDDMSALGTGRLGLIVSFGSPKELAFGVGAGLLVGGSDLAQSATVAVVAYTVVACATVWTPVLAMVVLGEKMRAPLQSARGWMVANKGRHRCGAADRGRPADWQRHNGSGP